MKVFMFHSEDSAVGYYRIFQPAYWMKKLGLADVKRVANDCKSVPVEKKDRDKNGSLEELAEWADLLVFQRRETYIQYSTISAIQEIYKKPCVFEADDDMINIDRFHPQYDVHKLKDINEAFEVMKVPVEDSPYWLRTKRVVKMSEPDRGCVTMVLRKDWDCGWLYRNGMKTLDAMTVTTKTLQDVYLPYNPNVYVLPNCIDFDIWDKLPKKKENKNLVIGWAGGWQHIKDLEVIYSVIDKILSSYPGVHFHWVRCKTKEMDRLQKRFPNQMKFLGDGCVINDWPKSYAKWNFDIGIAPLWHSKFNKGKSNLKWLENSARKIPTVATDIVTYQDIKNGQTGYLCKSTGEWVAAISELIENDDLRKQVGQNAYDEVKSLFNAKNNAQRYVDAYQSILTNHKPKEDEKCQLVSNQV